MGRGKEEGERRREKVGIDVTIHVYHQNLIGEQLVAETNPKERLSILRLEVGADVVNSLSAEFRVSRAITEEEIVQL